MKLLKKALSLALAGIMALGMLTACGGGGSTPAAAVTFETSKTLKILNQIAAKKFYVEAEFSASSGSATMKVNPIIAVSGDNQYIKAGSTQYWTDANYGYVPVKEYFSGANFQTPDNVLIKTAKSSSSSSTADIASSVDNVKKQISGFEAGTKEIGGIPYYSETITTEINGTKASVTLCFASDTWKYLIVSGESKGMTVEYTITINKFTTSFDESLVKIPDSYTERLTQQEFFEKYVYNQSSDSTAA